MQESLCAALACLRGANGPEIAPWSSTLLEDEKTALGAVIGQLLDVLDQAKQLKRVLTGGGHVNILEFR